MKKLNLPDEIKTTIGTIKTDIYELGYDASFHLAAGFSFFYAAGESNKSITSVIFSMLGAGILAMSVDQIERIQEKKKEIEEYEQGKFIQGNVALEEKQNQLDMAKSNFKSYASETLLDGGLLGLSSLALIVNHCVVPELAFPTFILLGGRFSLDGYKTVKERKKVKQLEKSTTSRGSK